MHIIPRTRASYGKEGKNQGNYKEIIIVNLNCMLKLKIGTLEQEIRDFLNNSIRKKNDLHFKKQNGDWNQLFTALDVIGDTCLAIENFTKETDD